MVDLVKIRKKAKKKSSADGPSAVEPAAAPAPVVVEEPPAPPAGEAAGSTAGEPPALPGTKLERFREQAGRRRQSEAAKVEETGAAAHLELLTFIIAREQYAVDIERIVEIVTPRPTTRIPNADVSVVGIISLRGTIVTLVDVRRKLRHPPAGEPDADTRIVVVDYRNEMVGFVVDRVLRVVKTASEDIEAHPVVHATELDEAVRGVFRVSGALTILLDLDKLLENQKSESRNQK